MAAGAYGVGHSANGSHSAKHTGLSASQIRALRTGRGVGKGGLAAGVPLPYGGGLEESIPVKVCVCVYVCVCVCNGDVLRYIPEVLHTILKQSRWLANGV